jgi:hypothetical protein
VQHVPLQGNATSFCLVPSPGMPRVEALSSQCTASPEAAFSGYSRSGWHSATAPRIVGINALIEFVCCLRPIQLPSPRSRGFGTLMLAPYVVQPNTSSIIVSLFQWDEMKYSLRLTQATWICLFILAYPEEPRRLSLLLTTCPA